MRALQLSNAFCFASILSLLLAHSATCETPVEIILSAYVTAVGGEKAVNAITTREMEIHHLLGPNLKLYWAVPDKVLTQAGVRREGFDGSTGWVETKRKRIEKLLPFRRDELEIYSNPLRFVHMKAMYRELNAAATETVDGNLMDVLIAPNSVGSTKFFFGHDDHLLHRIEEFGISSVYFKTTTDFADYRKIDSVRLPCHIVRRSEEPGVGNDDVQLSRVKQNVELSPELFRKPEIGKVVSGGKH